MFLKKVSPSEKANFHFCKSEHVSFLLLKKKTHLTKKSIFQFLERRFLDEQFTNPSTSCASVFFQVQLGDLKIQATS